MIRPLAWGLAAVAVVLVFVDRPWAGVTGLGMAVTAALVVDRRVVAIASRLGIILTLLFSSAVAGAVVVWSSDLASGLQVASGMLLRLMVLVVIASLLARNVDAEALLRSGERLGMERLGLTLGLALNVLPQLSESTRQVFMAWRVRRRSSVTKPPSILQLLEVLLAHVARIADEAAAAAALRGHSALVQPPVVVATAAPVVVATGKPGAGKTTAVLETAEQLHSQGCRVVGIVQLGRFVDGDKIGFAVRDLENGDEADLALLVPRGEGDHGTRFRFSEDGFVLAERALGKVKKGDVLVVDELGPLELRGEGHMPAVQRALQVPGLTGILIVVRAQLVPALLGALRVDEAHVVDATAAGGTDQLLAALAIDQHSRGPKPTE